MDFKSFPTQFEMEVKSRLARELDLFALSQGYNVDFSTKMHQDSALADPVLIEMKLRREYPRKQHDHFSPRKGQYEKIIANYFEHKDTDKSSGKTKTFHQTVWDEKTGKLKKYFPKKLTYFFLKYMIPKDIKEIDKILDIIGDVRLTVGYLTDYIFVPKYDTAGKKSLWYSVTETSLRAHAAEVLGVHLLNSEFPLYIVPSGKRYVRKFARSLFSKHLIGEQAKPIL